MLHREAQILEVHARWSTVVTFAARIVRAPEVREGDYEVGDVVPALAYTDLVGEVNVGDYIRIDCSALAKSLGTGGFAMTLSTENLPNDSLPTGHIVKARYTPYQQMVLAVEEEVSDHRHVIESADSLQGALVIIADLHSAVPAVATALKAADPTARIAYIMDDTAALPIAFSRAVDILKNSGTIAVTVTSGQSYGGDFEAASMPSALLSAKSVCGADYIIVAQGPGNLGTGTPFGFSGTAVADTIHAVHALEGIPIPVVRASQADGRPEHLGISHHCLTTMIRLTLVKTTIPLVDPDTLTLSPAVDDCYRQGIAHLAQHHDLRFFDADRCRAALAYSPVRLSTMGRTFADDELAFTSAAAAGLFATTIRTAPDSHPSR